MSAWLHPALVHFAIALLLAGVVLDVVGLWRASEKLVFAGFFNTVLGTLGAVAATASGWAATRSAGPFDPLGGALLQFHEVFSYAGTLAAVVLCGARLAMRGIVRPRFRTLYLATALVMAVLIGASGAVGGVSVYAYGVGITPDAARRVLDAQGAGASASVPARPSPATPK